ncbi:hypothetical protein MIZ03_2210 [Rhodoferax lithotrophicus]|uniref:Transposase n=1 Tax=Rhodoferax lithotrophicus TaxID=2798804 RepID=A0ABM7MM77_9BURK|nr:hypothetical protein MIZ03_2210 [Rhodoferax sp. MIZ03]
MKTLKQCVEKIVSACVRRFNAAESIKSNLNLLGLDTFKK